VGVEARFVALGPGVDGPRQNADPCSRRCPRPARSGPANTVRDGCLNGVRTSLDGQAAYDTMSVSDVRTMGVSGPEVV
jgi:hypothetical protein